VVRKSIPPRGKLLILEAVIFPGNELNFSKMIDLTMLVVTGGKERTEREYEALLAASGFAISRMVRTSAGVDVLEAVPV
jgi:hypothetical protein